MTKQQARTRIKLRGASGYAEMRSHEPIIEFIPGGWKYSYLWIGNNAEEGKTCYATLSGEMRLRKLAEAILAGLER